MLVVDHDRATRDAVAHTLLAEGYRVFAAPDGATALAIIEWARQAGGRQFALILLDLWTPGMDGWQFAARYRQLPGPHAPIIIAAAEPGAVAALHAEQIGAAGFLTKPFDLEALPSFIAGCVQADGAPSASHVDGAPRPAHGGAQGGPFTRLPQARRSHFRRVTSAV
ncbi:MAG TPA: response regulator [Chloroflexota bacterium]|nr:response regulator [Chloroflexota bacterium]